MAKQPDKNTEGIQLAIEEHDFSLKKRGQARIDKRLRYTFITLAATVVVVFVGLIMPTGIFNEAAHTGGYNNGYTLAWFFKDLSFRMNMFFAMLTGDLEVGGRLVGTLVTYIVIVLCGAGLALCGAVYQGTFRNALVSPSSLGVMSGASLGMALWVVLLYDPEATHGLWFESEAGAAASTVLDPLLNLWNSYSLSLCSFVGCVLVVAVVVAVIGTVGRGSTSGLMMIITGQILGGIMGGIVSTLRYYFVTVAPDGPQATMLMELQISSFYRYYTWIDIIAVGIPVLIMFLVVMHYRSQLMLMAFSEAEARTMGVETRRLRYIIIGLATLVTAIIVSFCGRVGFVGFMLPLLARRLVGPNFTYLLPLCMAGGGAFVLIAYILVTVIFGTGMATMSGMFISIAGTVVFLVSAIRGTGGKRGAF